MLGDEKCVSVFAAAAPTAPSPRSTSQTGPHPLALQLEKLLELGIGKDAPRDEQLFKSMAVELGLERVDFFKLLDDGFIHDPLIADHRVELLTLLEQREFKITSSAGSGTGQLFALFGGKPKRFGEPQLAVAASVTGHGLRCGGSRQHKEQHRAHT